MSFSICLLECWLALPTCFLAHVVCRQHIPCRPCFCACFTPRTEIFGLRCSSKRCRCLGRTPSSTMGPRITMCFSYSGTRGTPACSHDPTVSFLFCTANRKQHEKVPLQPLHSGSGRQAHVSLELSLSERRNLARPCRTCPELQAASVTLLRFPRVCSRMLLGTMSAFVVLSLAGRWLEV